MLTNVNLKVIPMQDQATLSVKGTQIIPGNGQCDVLQVNIVNVPWVVIVNTLCPLHCSFRLEITK